MTVDEYAEQNYQLGLKYAEDVRNGKETVGSLIKLAIIRYFNDLEREDLLFDQERVLKAFKFFYFLNVNIKNKYQRFQFLPFQAFILINLFGFYYTNSLKRRYRYFYLMIGRKNGKTTFAAALLLYFLIADGQVDPEALMVATTREQAAIALDYAKSIIQNSPEIRTVLDSQRSRIIFKDRRLGGFAKIVSSVAEKLDGYSCSAALIDEIHAHKDDSLFNIVKSSTLARKDPIMILITTAGFSLTSFGFNYTKYARSVVNGEIEDDSLFAMIFQLDKGDDISDPKNWYKSNPAMGQTFDIDVLKESYNQALFSESQMNNFKTKHLNIFVSQESSWLPPEIISESRIPFKIEDLYGSDIYLGMDLSSVRDLTSIVGVVEKDGVFYSLSWFFMVNDGSKFHRNAGVNLLDWIKDGYIIEGSKKTIDYSQVADMIGWINSKFNLRLLMYDPNNAASILNYLYDMGINVKPFQQRAQMFNEPLKYIEKLLFDKKIYIDNPVLEWNLNNVILYVDGNYNQKIMKNKSLDAVDGAVALAQAVGAYLHLNNSAVDLSQIYQ